MVFHVLNRGVGRRTLFEKPADYLAFERVVDETLRVYRMRICAYCLMPNHWHFIMWPEHDEDLSSFMQQLTNTHVKRWKQHYHESGYGHLYQGRFKSFPVQTNDYSYQVTRYVERNALRANLVERAEAWPWSSLGCGHRPIESFPLTSDWPLNRPTDWLEIVNRPQSDAELAALRRCVNRGCPLGDDLWSSEIEKRLGLESTKRARGRPRKEETIKSS
jgi:putative transposase